MYTDLAHARTELKVNAADVSDDAYVLLTLPIIEARIDQFVGFTFAPLLETRTFDARGEHIDDERRELHLDHPVLTVTSLVDGTGTALAPTDYRLLSSQGGSCTTYDRIRRVSGSWSSTNGDYMDAIQITGVWGYHAAYGQAWGDSRDAVEDTGGIHANVTVITVGDADSADDTAWTPRFCPGQLLKIEAEYLTVEAVNTTTNVLTVRRGQRGSAAAAHAKDTPLYIWRPDALVQRAANRWLALVYARRGQFQQVTYDGLTTVEFPADIPDEVRHMLAVFQQSAFDSTFLVV